MIEIKMTGPCEGCDVADLELKRMETGRFFKEKWVLRCKHSRACERMYEKATEEKE